MSIIIQRRIKCDYCIKSIPFHISNQEFRFPQGWQVHVASDGTTTHCCFFGPCLEKFKQDFPEQEIVVSRPRKKKAV